MSTADDAGDDRPAVMRPLWLRLLTGRPLAWRVRVLRRRIVHGRRRLARHAVRRINLNAEVRALLDAGRPLAAFRAARTASRVSAGVAPVMPARGRWPVMPLPVGICGVAPTHPLVRYVEPAAAVTAVLVGGDCGHDPAVHARPIVGVGVAPPRAKVIVGGGRDSATVWLPEPLDPAVHNPAGFAQREPGARVAITGTELCELDRRPSHGLQTARSVECKVRPNDDPVAVARGIVTLAAQGVPLVTSSLPAPAAEIVGQPLATLVTSATAADMQDDRTRELHSVRLRRAAYRAHGPAVRWRQIAAATGIVQPTSPSVSVLLATKRPQRVLAAARQVAAQRGDRPQLVVGLHGSGIPDDIADRLRHEDLADVAVHTFDVQKNLGEILDALARAADGEVIAKWDDDDSYAPDHLDDLRIALQYSGEVLVGKAAEFVYLEKLDLTIRRHAVGAERPTTTVAGGTLSMARADLLAIGGWPSAVKRADRHLIARVHDHGGRAYRTHGFGYVLHRAGSPTTHTWHVGDDYFLLAATDQRPGLDLEFVGFDGDATPLAPDTADALAEGPS